MRSASSGQGFLAIGRWPKAHKKCNAPLHKAGKKSVKMATPASGQVDSCLLAEVLLAHGHSGVVPGVTCSPSLCLRIGFDGKSEMEDRRLECDPQNISTHATKHARMLDPCFGNLRHGSFWFQDKFETWI